MTMTKNLKIGIALATLVGVAALLNNRDHDPEADKPHAPVPNYSALDRETLTDVGSDVLARGIVVKYDVSGWSDSFNLTLGSRDNTSATTLANAICGQSFARPLHYGWTVRVYLVDGTLAAQCPMR